MPRTLCLSGAGSGAGCGARCALGEFLARGANMIGTQVGVSLHHNRCLPAAGLLEDTDYGAAIRSEEHTSELQSLAYLVCRLLLEKKKNRAAILLLTHCVSRAHRASP